jgi:hypothetical protein
MNLFNRIAGVFLNPQQTTKAISEKPIWVDALIIVLLAVALFSYFTMPYQQNDTLEMMKNSVSMQERMGQERFDQYIEGLENPSKSGTLLRSFALGPISIIVGFLFQCLILVGLGRLSTTEGKFMQVFAVFLHARFIDVILGGALRTFLVMSRKAFMSTSTSLAMFFPKMEIATPAFIILSQIDFFQLWAYGVLGIGLSHVFKVDMKKGLILAYAVWALKTALYIALGLFSLRYMG